jgi:hypothetical protein
MALVLTYFMGITDKTSLVYYSLLPYIQYTIMLEVWILTAYFLHPLFDLYPLPITQSRVTLVFVKGWIHP